MHLCRRLAGTFLALAVLAGCGGQPAPTRPDDAAGPAPALATRPAAPGEIVLRGETSPHTHGPISLSGAYVVRFAQYDPQDPHTDFTDQTAFVAALTSPDRRRSLRVPLFRTAAPAGRTQIRVDGRYLVDVSFGDFPYVVRFTPEP